MLPNFGLYTLPGVEDRRAPSVASVIILDQDKVPATFPMTVWRNMAVRYLEYWRWFNGDILNEKRAKSKDSTKDIPKYPLGINPVRNFARKHAAVLLGEETFDTGLPLVKTSVIPRPALTVDYKSRVSTNNYNEDDKALAIIAENVVNSVWADSKGRALQEEAATLSQFLGGAVFQVCWEYHRRNELQIPITIKSWPVDFFVPIWRSDDPYDLLEAFIVYRVPTHTVNQMYGLDLPNSGFSIYCEHWTKSYYSVTIDGQPLTSNYTGTVKTYDHLKNPFGFVPFVYIPHLREGNFFGSSIVEDIRGLTRELNARAADTGDAIRDTVHRKRYARDLQGNAKPIQLDNGLWAINLGATNPATKATPDVFTEDPPAFSAGLLEFNEKLWDQLLREGQIGDIAFGEDEGSQRSALTLAFRMWPSTAHARAERTFWTDGLNTLAKMILDICVIKSAELKDIISIPADYRRRVSFAQDWLPMIPRDREQMVNEVILRFQAGLLSPEKALEMLGDVEYIMEEVEAIKQWLQFQAQLAAPAEVGGSAPTETQTPVATSGLGLND